MPERFVESQVISQDQRSSIPKSSVHASYQMNAEEAKLEIPIQPMPRESGLSPRASQGQASARGGGFSEQPLSSYDPKSVTVEKLIKHNPHDLTAMLLAIIEEQY